MGTAEGVGLMGRPARMKAYKTHYFAENGRRTLCEALSAHTSFMSINPSEVTCKSCLARLNAKEERAYKPTPS